MLINRKQNDQPKPGTPGAFPGCAEVLTVTPWHPKLKYSLLEAHRAT